jgi:hypothetical protein
MKPDSDLRAREPPFILVADDDPDMRGRGGGPFSVG